MIWCGICWPGCFKDDNEKIAADQVEVVDEITIRMTITQGKYHQVKRMVAAAGNRVMDLHRLSVGSVQLGDLDEGQWRYLEADELASFGFGLENKTAACALQQLVQLLHGFVHAADTLDMGVAKAAQAGGGQFGALAGAAIQGERRFRRRNGAGRLLFQLLQRQ
jgi:hypothetical protein